MSAENSQLDMVQDVVPPALAVRFPAKTVRKRRHVLTGSTDPGAKVFVMGKEIDTDADGGFRHNMKLQRGINIIVVEAFDAAGNVAYESRLINRKY